MVDLIKVNTKIISMIFNDDEIVICVPTELKRILDMSLRWRKKTRGYSKKTLDGAFDRFFSLVVSYAAITSAFYNPYEMGSEDKKRFTEYPIQYLLGNNRIINKLTRYVEEMSNVIHTTPFSIELWDRESIDLEIWESADVSDKDKIRTLLRAIYAMRCNLFHGDKNYEEIQFHLLTPTNECLRIIIKTLTKQLEKQLSN